MSQCPRTVGQMYKFTAVSIFGLDPELKYTQSAFSLGPIMTNEPEKETCFNIKQHLYCSIAGMDYVSVNIPMLLINSCFP